MVKNTELNDSINRYITKKHSMDKKRGIPVHGIIKLSIYDIPMSYDTENSVIKVIDKFGRIEYGRKYCVSESESFKRTTVYSNIHDTENKIITCTSLRECDGFIYKTDSVETNYRGLGDFLLENGFIRDEDSYYKLSEVEYNESLFDPILSEITFNPIFKYIDERSWDKEIKEDNLRDLIRFENEKTITLIVYKNMLKKYLKKSKTKNFTRKSNSKGN